MKLLDITVYVKDGHGEPDVYELLENNSKEGDYLYIGYDNFAMWEQDWDNIKWLFGDFDTEVSLFKNNGEVNNYES